MKLKNRPRRYVKRSDLPGRLLRAKKVVVGSERRPKDRNFATVEIDANFYFTFCQGADQKNR
ncbi:hypothetical protein [Bradyrhizobium sp. OK095]|uniref:hypothetical protein n=1 Tax=Bradyrhizobium sp. OK095 TaxID=1882760 RepID=UPI0008B3380D|nr:hypothetical protein [Bradyrhizobium sp. OK095]SEM97671.1 hypothetical protein SAMN05443254_10598 [Bradyrhizobium sp. OK095]